MKMPIRLVLIGTIGLVGVFFIGRDSLVARLRGLGLGDEPAMGSVWSSAEGDQPVFFTEWLASDLFKAAPLPVWTQSEGRTAETMRAYAILHEARQDSESLEEENKKVVRHMESKDQSLTRLVERKIHLFDAATEWLELDRAYGHGKTDQVNSFYPGNSEIERYCQRVLRELELRSVHQSNPYRNALSRARGELRELMARGTYISSN